MRVEFFKPKHFEDAAGAGTYDEYKLPTGDTTITLEDNCAFFPYGIINKDASFDYMKWYEGAKTIYIGDWFTLPVYSFEEKQGAYKGNLQHYEFRAGETFTYTVSSTTTPTPSEVNAWILAFMVLPRSKSESKVYKS